VGYRWGIAATGGIAAGFADAMRLVDGGEVVAVASRSSERAREFGIQRMPPRQSLWPNVEAWMFGMRQRPSWGETHAAFYGLLAAHREQIAAE